MAPKGRQEWLGLAIGNSRLHWAWFVEDRLELAWDTPHLPASEVEGMLPALARQHGESLSQFPLYVASVVPEQTQLWVSHPTTQVIKLWDLPLGGLYPTLGVDRALAGLGAGEVYGYPVLVLDGGTALTLTGVDNNRCLVGGAILPGLGLQLKSLQQNTGALPEISLPSQLPTRWAKDTHEAIASGVIYTIVAGIQDFIKQWRCQFPDSKLAITGGDSTVLLNYLQTQLPELASQIIADPHLIFWGMRHVKQ